MTGCLYDTFLIRKEERKMLKKLIVKTVAEAGKTIAKATVNVNCPWIHYQPKEPDAVKRLRKDSRDI